MVSVVFDLSQSEIFPSLLTLHPGGVWKYGRTDLGNGYRDPCLGCEVTWKASSEYVNVVVCTTCGEVKFVLSRRRSVVPQNIHFRCTL